MLADRTIINQSTYILLLSDGCDSNLINLDIRIEKAIKEFKPKIKEIFKIHTFGYGASHDSKILDKIAEFTGGNFYYIENELEICTTFALCMGEIVSELARDIQISISTNDCGVPFNLSCMNSDDNVFTLPDLLYNDEKNLVFVISFLPINVDLAGQTVVPVEVQSTFTLINGQKITKTAKLDIKFASEKEKVSKNQKVLIEYYRVKGAKCLKSALILADQGKFKEAEELFRLSEIEISSSEVANEPFIKSLINDLIISKKSVESKKSWTLGGRARTNSNECKHARSKSNSTGSYENETQKRYKQLSNNYMQKSYNGSEIESESDYILEEGKKQTDCRKIQDNQNNLLKKGTPDNFIIKEENEDVEKLQKEKYVEENKQDINNGNLIIKQNQSIIKESEILQSDHTFSNQNDIKNHNSSHEKVKINIQKKRQTKSVDLKIKYIKSIAIKTNAPESAQKSIFESYQSKNINNLKEQKTSIHTGNSVLSQSIKPKIFRDIVPILNEKHKKIKVLEKSLSPLKKILNR